MKALGYYAVVTGKGKQSTTTVVIFISLPHTLRGTASFKYSLDKK